MRHRWLSTCFAAALVAALVACKGDDSNSQPSEDSSGETSGCTKDPRVTAFASGDQAKSASGRIVVEIVNANPSPPVRGEGDAGMNTWTLKITLDGKPPAADAVTVSTLMPDHGHRSPLVPTVVANGDGTYALNDLYLFMGGVWQIMFTPANDVTPADMATFTFCVN